MTGHEVDVEKLYRELADVAAKDGAPAPTREEVAAFVRELAGAMPAAAVPQKLAAAVTRSLEAEVLKAVDEPARDTQPDPAPPAASGLLGLMWAEARYLSWTFFSLQAVLIGGALLLNQTLLGMVQRGELGAGAAGPQTATSEMLTDTMGFALDGLTLAAPWLGLLIAVYSLLPGRAGVWDDLVHISHFSPAQRLLARTGVALLLVTAVLAAMTALSPGPAAAQTDLSAWLVLLARMAPLLLAVAWALFWACAFGVPSAIAASAALWLGLTLFRQPLGSWDLFATPGVTTTVWAPVTALAAAVLLLGAAVFRVQSQPGYGRDGT